jgi:hypothetical protein
MKRRLELLLYLKDCLMDFKKNCLRNEEEITAREGHWEVTFEKGDEGGIEYWAYNKEEDRTIEGYTTGSVESVMRLMKIYGVITE